MHICPMEIIPILMALPFLRITGNKVRMWLRKGLRPN